MPIPNTKVLLNSTLLAGGGFTLTPNAAGDFSPALTGVASASWVAGVGDLNGDGVADIAIGSAGDDDKAVDAGRIFVTLSSFAAGTTHGIADALPGSLIIDGVNAGDMAGSSIAGIADMNGDGMGELLIGAPGMARGAAADAGAAFVVWGDSLPGGVDLNDPFTGGGKGYAIKGQSAGDMAGTVVLSVGDMNGDGIADVLVGAPGQDAGGLDAGAAYVVWGKTTDSIVQLTNVAAGTGGFKIIGADGGDAIGSAMAVLGDQNGDGKAELLIGVRDDNTAGSNAGAVYVVDGKATGTAVDLSDVALGIGGYKISGVAQDDAGAAVAGIGDVNGDGLDDILIGAPRSDRAYVVYGKNDHVNVDLADVRGGVGGFQIIAEGVGDLDSMVVTGGVDLNRDGIDDLVIGASLNSEGGSDAGAVYVVWGGGGTGTIDLSQIAQGFGGAKIVGSAGSLLGTSVAIGGDMNGDGVADLILGAPGVGESVQVLYTPLSWQPDVNIYGTAGDDVMLPGFGGMNVIDAGNDAIMGLAGNDSIDGDGGADLIEGGSGNDTLLGGLGSDTLDGGTGADSMVGGAGFDVFIVDNAGDVVVETDLFDSGDIVRASVSHTLSANVENLTLLVAGLTGTGNELMNVMNGSAGIDTLDGGANGDWMIGGSGNDVYHVDTTADIVDETAAGGTDTVISTVNLTLAANVENLTLSGAALTGTGNALNNLLVGNALANILDGSLGTDTLRGGAGDDSYIVDATSDQIVELLSEGNDTVTASVNYTLAANVEALFLTGAARQATGNALDNVLGGTIGNDTLNGMAGADLMNGGKGDDTYHVDDLSDQTFEVLTGGVDTLIATVDYALGANIENLVLAGAARAGVGNSQNNTLTGTAFADMLNGGTGADTMIGGAGDDTYIVDAAGDVVTEDAGGGDDTVMIYTGHTLDAELENLIAGTSGLTGTGNALNNQMTGSAGADSLLGLDGADTLDGGAGADCLGGGAGNDTYIIDNIGDVIVEGVAGGIDTVIVMVDGLTIGANVENIRLGGTAHVLIGGDDDNSLTGSNGDDDLDGGDGDDLLVAGAGNDDLRSDDGDDTMAGGDGDDTYHVSGGHVIGDRVEIEDYLGHDDLDCSTSTGNDHIDLSGETETEVEDCVVVIPGGGNVSSPMDVQFLQDLSGSFGDDIATVRGLVPGIVTALQAIQANSQFGVSSFIDKPVNPFGASGEWVYNLHLAQTNAAATLAATYNSLGIMMGNDGPEAQIEGLMQLALHATEAGFRPDAARFVILFTDAPFHLAGDGATGGILTPNNGDNLFPGGGAMEDYPTIAQVQAALVAANIIPIFAIAGGYETTYQNLATQLGRGAVVTLTSNSSNIISAITAGMTAATTTHIEDCHAGSGDDNIIGSVGDNGLWVAVGNDSIDGLGGDDSLDGGAGHDLLTGGTGNDTLRGGSGNDAVHAGDGDDDVLVGRAEGFDDYDGGAGSDDITALAVNTVIGVTGLTGIETISSGGFAGVRLTGSALGNLIDLTGTVLTGIGTIDGAAGADTILGSAGNDVIQGGIHNDSLSGNDGDDIFFVGAGHGFDNFDGGAGTDLIEARASNTAIGISGLSGVETISAGAFTGVRLVGSNAANLIDLSPTLLTGIQSVEGGSGADTIVGSAGDDRIIGGVGKDVLTGGLGADCFVFAVASHSRGANYDTITDFVRGADMIDLSAIDADSLTAGDQSFTFVGTTAFSHTAGELRIILSTSGYVRILADVDGNGTSDFELRLTATSDLVGGVMANDFLL